MNVTITKQVAIRKAKSYLIKDYKLIKDYDVNFISMIDNNKNALIEAIRDGIITAIETQDFIGNFTWFKVV
jgi:predicted methyltransferase MtxX (methanogen marker protein 4)